jgi:sulfur-carrier protein
VSVQVNLPTVLRPHAGGERTVAVDGGTVGEVLTTLVAQYPGMSGQVIDDAGSLHKFVNIYLNDDDVRYLSGVDTPVGAADELSILPAVAGGAFGSGAPHGR